MDIERGERSTRTDRGAQYIGYYKRVNAPWFFVLFAFVNCGFPPIVRSGVFSSSIGNSPSAHRIDTPFDERTLRPTTDRIVPSLEWEQHLQPKQRDAALRPIRGPSAGEGATTSANDTTTYAATGCVYVCWLTEPHTSTGFGALVVCVVEV